MGAARCIRSDVEGRLFPGSVAGFESKGADPGPPGGALECRALDREEWLEDDRFNTPGGRIRNNTIRLNMTAEVLATKPTAHWLKVLDEHSVPSAPVLTRKELLTHEQILTNELIEELEQPGLGKIRQARPAARFSKTPAKIQGEAPHIGQHSRDIMTQFGLSNAEINGYIKDDIVR